MTTRNRVFIAIDGDNLYHLKKIAGWKIDLYQLKEFIANNFGDLVESIYYISIYDGKETNKGRFLKTLSKFGYSIVSRQVKQIRQLDGSVKIKGNMDVKMALDAVLASHKYDTYVLVSGDSDFDCLVETLKTIGKNVYVLATNRTISSELRELVGQNYIDFEEIRKYVDLEKSGNEEDADDIDNKQLFA